MKSIEQRIYEKMIGNVSESMKFNQSVSKNIASVIDGMNLKYEALVVTPSRNISIPVYVYMTLNEDDIEAVESDNVVYVYLKASNLDFKLELLNSAESNLAEIINSINSWISNNPKCWKDNDNLYLLKMNRNTGIVSRYDSHTNTFKKQDSINYINAIDYDIAKTLLNRDYLEDYISNQLCLLKSSIDYKDDSDLLKKMENEKTKICITK